MSASTLWRLDVRMVAWEGGVGVGHGVVAVEICAGGLLLLCWLCCWPGDDNRSDSSSGKYPQRPVISQESGSRRRSSEGFQRRVGTSAASLHLPSTSAHRSHEEIRSRRKSHVDKPEEEMRYYSAPSVIEEVLHRRDWERSSKELHIPLHQKSEDSEIGTAPRAEQEVTSDVDLPIHENTENKVCKKHNKNIKSSKKYNNNSNKENMRHDVKDKDATESISSHFYIGDTNEGFQNSIVTNTASLLAEETFNVDSAEDKLKSSRNTAKEVKQSINESIRSKDRPNKIVPVKGNQVPIVFDLKVDEIDELDRSGAMHHSLDSRSSLLPCLSRLAFPPISVEPVSYEGGACYLAEAGRVTALRRAPEGDGMRGGRHASDGDILAPPLRPESGAFSESDLDLDLESSEERPPAYSDLHRLPTDARETAI